MATTAATDYVAECFWPGVTPADLTAMDERAAASAAEASREGSDVSYLGSLLMRDDEVVLCRFHGVEADVRSVAKSAAIPFDRILEVSGSAWNLPSA